MDEDIVTLVVDPHGVIINTPFEITLQKKVSELNNLAQDLVPGFSNYNGLKRRVQSIKLKSLL